MASATAEVAAAGTHKHRTTAMIQYCFNTDFVFVLYSGPQWKLVPIDGTSPPKDKSGNVCGQDHERVVAVYKVCALQFILKWNLYRII